MKAASGAVTVWTHSLAGQSMNWSLGKKLYLSIDIEFRRHGCNCLHMFVL